MELYYSPTSPYVRNVLAAFRHHQMSEAVEIVATNPFEQREMLTAKNPLGKVPALKTDEGEVLFDSRVIVDFIDQLGNGDGLFDDDELSPHTIKYIYALTDGILDAAVSSVIELKRPKEQQSEMWLARWEENIKNSVVLLEQELAGFADKKIMPYYSSLITLDYLDFRLPHIKWREKVSTLPKWFENNIAQDFFKETDPRNA